MPTVGPGSKILVTGANGYIPIWVVRRLLEKGYSVRGTVRSADKGQHLQDTFKSYGDKLEIVVVPDITKDGAFDEAVKGVDAIEHMASPFHENVDDPKEFIEPAVNGTVGILKSALKNAPDVKRIVITSSVAAILTDTTAPSTFSERDWNEASIKEMEEKGREAAPMAKYRASKTLAEKAAWDFYNKHKSEVKWDISVLNPPFVFGPMIQQVSSPTSLNTSMQYWWNFVIEDGQKSRQALSASNSWVDVRDLADAHILALEKEAAGGERIIISQGPFVWQEWIDIARSIQPSPLPNRKLPEGFPDIKKSYDRNYDASKEKRILGVQYTTKEQATKDMLEDFAKRGW
ncbi:D-lactaldehyde dehydrogenase [Coprinopsis cinerea okayama7|uniref:D-lactaldehyde dehydrogenase n=1 Tax=Coprinopsis cinerea (strain Okayama-7 / 130 / ATCC MYA-4618 / FGSC 9003) TaxID=240176 RepID=D6RJM8_COPC7|nr:D-lactaldehyde dehydrogenase [Coprinopsis cinerea okayama7\|eukprot:XP_002912039.1 D-lactaldehyde dehydrogenase [Coprinopsis cinerea okayama7\